jgi:hypothetical protein
MPPRTVVVLLVVALWVAALPACRSHGSATAAEGNAFAAADRRLDRTHEIAVRAHRYLDLWLARIDPETGLLPRESADEMPARWRPADNAADNYPYLVLAAAMFDDELLAGPMEQLLREEVERTTRLDGLVDEYSIAEQSFVFPDIDVNRLLYNTAEYTKDGLTPVTDLLGTSPWSDRLVALTDSIWRHAEFPARSGLLPSENLEVHGELLQVACRLYWRTGDPRYLEYASRIGDHYLLDEHLTRARDELPLRDHGNELIGGLSELYFAVRHADSVRYDQYRRPLHELLDDIAAYGRNDAGLIYDWMGTPAGDPSDHARALSDNWGYVLNAFFTAYLVDGTERYRQVVVDALEGLATTRGYDWEPPRPHDGLADTIEGAIMLDSYVPRGGTNEWISDQIDRMWAIEDERLIAGTDYLHGNVTRTSLMYLLMLTEGARVRPWSPDVAVGAVARRDRLFVAVEADRSWEGTLILDGERHSTIWGLPGNYPRINAFPEWYVVDPDASYRVRYVESNRIERHTGRELLDGIAITADDERLHVEVAPTRRSDS